MASEFFELTIQLLTEARQGFLDNSSATTVENRLNELVTHIPYHGYSNLPVNAFDERLKLEAPEEQGIFDHKPDSFPGLIDVLDTTAEEKFRELK